MRVNKLLCFYIINYDRQVLLPIETVKQLHFRSEYFFGYFLKLFILFFNYDYDFFFFFLNIYYQVIVALAGFHFHLHLFLCGNRFVIVSVDRFLLTEFFFLFFFSFVHSN